MLHSKETTTSETKFMHGTEIVNPIEVNFEGAARVLTPPNV